MKGLHTNKAGYLRARLVHDGVLYEAFFGRDSAENREIAEIWLATKRKEVLLGKIGIKPELPRKLFKDVATMFYERWSTELDPDGRPRHRNPKNTHYFITGSLIPFFGDFYFDEIKPKDILKWRAHRLQTVAGTSVNREQAVLGSIFTRVKEWINTEQIKAFKLPVDPQTGEVWNPSTPVEKASLKTHDKLLSDYEITKIRMACIKLNDLDGWEIVQMILKGALSVSDAKRLEAGQMIDLNRAKTNVPIRIPIQVLTKLNFSNWPKRWKEIRKEAGLSIDRKSPEYVDAKVLRKTALNWAIEIAGLDRASKYGAHSDPKTTARNYRLIQMKDNEPLAKKMEEKVNGFNNVR